MSANEPEVMEPEPEFKVTDRRHSAIVKRDTTAIERAETTDSNALITQAMQIEGLTLAERLMLIDKVESIAVARQLAAAERAFYDALSAFQRECPVIKKTKPVYNKDGRTVRYWYAPLGQIVKQVGPLLAEHGLSYDFSDAKVIPFEESTGGPFLELVTNVHHAEGHSRGFPFKALIEDTDYMNPTQQAGSSNTYAKRYGFTNAFGILTADADFDGNDPQTMVTPNEARAARQPVSQPKATPTAQRAAAANPNLKRLVGPAQGDEPTIEESTIKVITKKMESGALGIADFKARFPGFRDVENPIPMIRRTDVNAIINWLANPAEN